MASPQTHRIRVFIDSSVLYPAALSATGPARVAATVNLKDASIVAAALRGRVDYLATHDVKTLLRYKEEVKRDLGVTLVQPLEVLVLLRGEQA